MWPIYALVLTVDGITHFGNHWFKLLKNCAKNHDKTDEYLHIHAT